MQFMFIEHTFCRGLVDIFVCVSVSQSINQSVGQLVHSLVQMFGSPVSPSTRCALCGGPLLVRSFVCICLTVKQLVLWSVPPPVFPRMVTVLSTCQFVEG